nr:unnamed protein product [Callosobruchus chinensis]
MFSDAVKALQHFKRILQLPKSDSDDPDKITDEILTDAFRKNQTGGGYGNCSTTHCWELGLLKQPTSRKSSS